MVCAATTNPSHRESQNIASPKTSARGDIPISPRLPSAPIRPTSQDTPTPDPARATYLPINGSSAFELSLTRPFASVALAVLISPLAVRTGTVKSRVSAGGWETWRRDVKKRLQCGKGDEVSMWAERTLSAGDEQNGENEAKGGMTTVLKETSEGPTTGI